MSSLEIMNIWNNTCDSLPDVRDNVQFVVTGHTVCLRGVYEEGGFHSRWFRYATDDVRLWRRASEGSRRPRSTTDDARRLEHRLR